MFGCGYVVNLLMGRLRQASGFPQPGRVLEKEWGVGPLLDIILHWVRACMYVSIRRGEKEPRGGAVPPPGIELGFCVGVGASKCMCDGCACQITFL